jgi:hypothetical protein
VPSFVNYKKGCTGLAAASDKVYQLLAHGQWFSLGTPASSTTKTGRYDIAEIGIKHQNSNSHSNYEEGKGWDYNINRFKLTLSHFCACPLAGPGFPMLHVIVFYIFSDMK